PLEISRPLSLLRPVPPSNPLPRWLLLAGGLLGSILAGWTAPVQAADDGTQIWGRWHYVKERSDSIGVAADTAGKDLPIGVRRIARARLFAALKPYQWVQLGRTGNQIQITTSDWPAICTDCGGAKIPWMRPDGKRQQVSTSFSGDVLRQTFAGS